MKSKIRSAQFRRKREGKTNYKKRLKLLQGGMLRLVIRRSSKNIITQIIEYNPKGDKVLVSASSKELEKFGWKCSRSNMPAAYLTGFLLGKKAMNKKFGRIVLDLGLAKMIKGGRICAALKGCLDAGLDVICDQSILPPDERIRGKHISDYAIKLKKESKFDKIFSGHIKNNIDVENIPLIFDEVKKKIVGEK